MGKRKERRAQNGGRRVKLDLWSADPVAPPPRKVPGAESKEDVETGVDDGHDQNAGGLSSSSISGGPTQENPLSLLGQYSDDEAEEKGIQNDADINCQDSKSPGSEEEQEEIASIILVEKDTTAQVEDQDADKHLPAEVAQLNSILDVDIQHPVVDCTSENEWIAVPHKGSGDYYYWNTRSGETTWEKPVGWKAETDPKSDLEGQSKAFDACNNTDFGSEQDVKEEGVNTSVAKKESEERDEGSPGDSAGATCPKQESKAENEDGPMEVIVACGEEQPASLLEAVQVEVATDDSKEERVEEKDKEKVEGEDEGKDKEKETVMTNTEINEDIAVVEAPSGEKDAPNDQLLSSLPCLVSNDEDSLKQIDVDSNNCSVGIPEHEEPQMGEVGSMLQRAEKLVQLFSEVVGDSLGSLPVSTRLVIEAEIRLSDIKALASAGELPCLFKTHLETQLKRLEEAFLLTEETPSVPNSLPGGQLQSYMPDNKSLESNAPAMDESDRCRNDINPKKVLSEMKEASEADQNEVEEGEIRCEDVKGYFTSDNGSNGETYKHKDAGFEAELPCSKKGPELGNVEMDMDVDMEVDDEVDAEPSVPGLEPPESNNLMHAIPCYPVDTSTSIVCATYPDDIDPVSIDSEDAWNPPPLPPDDEWAPPPPPDPETCPPLPPEDPPPLPHLIDPSAPPPPLYYDYNTPQYMPSAVYNLPSSSYNVVDYLPPQDYIQVPDTNLYAVIGNNDIVGDIVYPRETTTTSYYSEATTGSTDMTSGMQLLQGSTAVPTTPWPVSISSAPTVVSTAPLEVPTSTLVNVSLAASGSAATSSLSDINSSEGKKVLKGKAGKKRSSALVVASMLRTNKKVSSLVNKWKQANEELHGSDEDENDKALYDIEALEKKRQKEIEDWRRQQIVSGDASDNANFQPLTCDWRDKVKRARMSKPKEEKKESSTVIRETMTEEKDEKQKPDLQEFSKNLPAGWQAFWDEASAEVYYGNLSTRETSWERPVA